MLLILMMQITLLQRHVYNRTQLRDLVNRPFFRKESAIKECLNTGPNYETRSYETALYDRENPRRV